MFKLLHDKKCGERVPCECVVNAETAYDICMGAACTGSIQTLSFCHERGIGDWADADFLSSMLVDAGSPGHVEACQYLRSVGAQWPIEGLALDSEDYDWSHMWHLNILQWARSEGCPYGDWTSAHCEILAESEKWHALLQWVHQNGCPCDCPRPYQLP